MNRVCVLIRVCVVTAVLLRVLSHVLRIAVRFAEADGVQHALMMPKKKCIVDCGDFVSVSAVIFRGVGCCEMACSNGIHAPEVV